MKANVQIPHSEPGKNNINVRTLAVERCIEFFIGWIKWFEDTLILFKFPSNKKDSPNL